MTTGDGLPDVVVTAAASTTALAPQAEQTWDLLLEGRSGIGTLDKWFVNEFHSPVRVGGQLTERFDEILVVLSGTDFRIWARCLRCWAAGSGRTPGHPRSTPGG